MKRCPRCDTILVRRLDQPGWWCPGCGHDETDAGAPVLIPAPARPDGTPVEPAATDVAALADHFDAVAGTYESVADRYRQAATRIRAEALAPLGPRPGPGQ